MDSSINFIANFIPSLVAGEYQLELKQELTGTALTSTDAKGINTYLNAPVTQTFHVDAPQFVLSAADMGPCLPGPNGLGDYTWVMPQIQLNRKSLPWERKMSSDDRKIPWLALLLLRDDELIWNPATESPLFPKKVQEIAVVPSNVYWPTTLNRDCLGEPNDTPVQTIRIKTAAFKYVMPRLADLAMLTHCRVVTASPGNRQGEVDRTVAMVVANRFPPASPSGRCHCVLVSVEGFADKLVDNPSFPSGPAATGGSVQLAALRYWSFVSVPDGASGFVNGLGRGANTPEQLLLRVPIPSTVSDASVRWRLNSSYIAAEYAASGQSSTFAWYRGPFTATVPQPLPISGDDMTSSDAAMIYASDEGLFDLSYAAAWEIGRSLALADPGFSSDIYAFRKASYRLLALLIDRLRMSAFSSTSDLQAVLASDAIYNAFDAMIAAKVTEFIGRLSILGVPVLDAASPNPKTEPTDSLPPVVLARQFLSQPAVAALLGELVAEKLLPVAAWLAQLQLLCRVPFHHLVPDQRMLPQNSVRVFYLDQGWLDSLMAGAKSVGVEGSEDSLFYKAMRGVIDDAIQQEMDAYMLNLTGQPTGDKVAGGTQEAMSGILIRSSIVAHYPGLQISGLKAGNALKILRKEKLSDTVMLVIFLGLPDQVVISEPNAGLAMGCESGKIFRRTTSGTQIGQKTTAVFPTSGDFSQFFRPAGPTNFGANVLNITSGTTNLAGALSTALGFTVDAADLALQLIQTPDFFNLSTQFNAG